MVVGSITMGTNFGLTKRNKIWTSAHKQSLTSQTKICSVRPFYQMARHKNSISPFVICRKYLTIDLSFLGAYAPESKVHLPTVIFEGLRAHHRSGLRSRMWCFKNRKNDFQTTLNYWLLSCGAYAPNSKVYQPTLTFVELRAHHHSGLQSGNEELSGSVVLSIIS